MSLHRSDHGNPVDGDFLVIGSGIAAASIGYWLAPHGRVDAARARVAAWLPQHRPLGGAVPGQLRHAAGARADAGQPRLPGRSRPKALPTYRSCRRAARCSSPRPSRPSCWTNTVRCCRRCRRCRGGSDRDADRWRMVPVLRGELLLGGAYEPDARDIDVHALHQGYLRGLRRHGGQLVCDAEAIAHRARAAGGWQVQAGGREYRAPVLINAAGAWCDEVAQLAGVRPIGLVPKRRSAFIFAPPPGIDVAGWPSVVGADESWYFKPDAGLLLGSPANADPVDAAGRAARGAGHRAGHRPHRDHDHAADPPAHTHLGGAAQLRRRRRPGRRLRCRRARLLLGGGAGRLRHPDLGGDGPGLRGAGARRCRSRRHRRLRPHARHAVAGACCAASEPKGKPCASSPPPWPPRPTPSRRCRPGWRRSANAATTRPASTPTT